MTKSVQLSLFREPAWLMHLRTLDGYREFASEIPLGYWRPSGFHRWRGLERGNDSGPCVGHLYEDCECSCGERIFYVLILFEDGRVEKFNPYSLFPASRPTWMGTLEYKEQL